MLSLRITRDVCRTEWFEGGKAQLHIKTCDEVKLA
jgi:hypothetical protein